MMEIALRLSDGQKEDFSKQEINIPTEGKWFMVNPLTIDQNLFKEKREDRKQETTRKLILEAFEEMKKNSKYTRPFKTMIPIRTMNANNIKAFRKIASKYGGDMADWVEQALEWAQRIANGEEWKNICNKKDTVAWYRSVIWKNGCIKLVGGSRYNYYSVPATAVSMDNTDLFYRSVPLVVLYE